MATLTHLTHILQQDCQLDFNRPVLIGVSGGPDSLCLLDILWQIGIQVIVAHLNHGLRKEALSDSLAVREAARARGLRFVLKEVDVAEYAKRNTLSIEEAARVVRYQFLFQQAREHQAQAVAVAHTADDQVETIIMHMLRGTGLSGLKGMSFRLLPNPWSTDLALVRPLLSTFHEEVLDYCQKFNLQFVYDRSNLDNTFYRNRIRQELVPTLETYNSNIKSLLLRMSETLAEDEITLSQYTEGAWSECCLGQRTGSVTLNVHIIKDQTISIQRRLIRRAISILRPGLRDIDFSIIERTLSFIWQPTRSKEMDLANGLRLVLEGDRLLVANWEDDLFDSDVPQLSGSHLQLLTPGCIYLPGGWYFKAEKELNLQDAFDKASTNSNPNQVWIDFKDREPKFTIRPPQVGDRFYPLGMEGHSMKLSDFFTNVKLPRRLRKNWPLVCIGDEVAWIPGYRLSHTFRLISNSSNIVSLQLLRK